MSSEEELKQFSRQEYWDDRYGRGDEHEWILEYPDLHEILKQLIPPPASDPTILHLGCGTSTLTRDMYEAGYRQQVNVDFSPEAIRTMKERCSRDGLTWLVQDVRAMKDIADGGIDVALDKCTLDAFLHGSLYDPPEDVMSNIKAYVDEVARVLASSGVFIYVTWRSPLFMKKFLERPEIWEMQMQNLQKKAGSFEYCVYSMVKKADREDPADQRPTT